MGASRAVRAPKTECEGGAWRGRAARGHFRTPRARHVTDAPGRSDRPTPARSESPHAVDRPRSDAVNIGLPSSLGVSPMAASSSVPSVPKAPDASSSPRLRVLSAISSSWCSSFENARSSLTFSPSFSTFAIRARACLMSLLRYWLYDAPCATRRVVLGGSTLSGWPRWLGLAQSQCFLDSASMNDPLNFEWRRQIDAITTM
mmetsp:Transcript_24455/g.43553  ORF Transcript_24455/g.43553 Transcript_24455/m.43553 type:complete len:202 (-) Transcript_24455:321-926(-)